MHNTLAIAAVYAHLLSIPFSSCCTQPEMYHTAHCVALFRHKLTCPIQPHDQDSLWATATGLFTLVFSSPEASTPEEAWPFISDLEWLSLAEGRSRIETIIDPFRSDSLCQLLSHTDYDVYTSIPRKDIADFVPELVSLCQLDISTAENNPYFKAAHILLSSKGRGHSVSGSC